MLNPDFKDMLSMFDEGKVEFLVVGAYAMAAHGAPRAPMEELALKDFVTHELVFQIGIEPNRIGLFVSNDAMPSNSSATDWTMSGERGEAR